MRKSADVEDRNINMLVKNMEGNENTENPRGVQEQRDRI